MTSLPATVEQTVGPFFSLGFEWLYRAESANQGATTVTLTGRVVDGAEAPINDAVLEFWHPALGLEGFLRVPTDDEGRFRITFNQPAQQLDLDGKIHAPHLAVNIFMRGLLRRVVSRVYFPEAPENVLDPVLNCVPAARRNTLIARAMSPGVLEWNVHMQGPNETAFFEFEP